MRSRTRGLTSYHTLSHSPGHTLPRSHLTPATLCCPGHTFPIASDTHRASASSRRTRSSGRPASLRSLSDCGVGGWGGGAGRVREGSGGSERQPDHKVGTRAGSGLGGEGRGANLSEGVLPFESLSQRVKERADTSRTRANPWAMPSPCAPWLPPQPCVRARVRSAPPHPAPAQPMRMAWPLTPPSCTGHAGQRSVTATNCTRRAAKSHGHGPWHHVHPSRRFGPQTLKLTFNPEQPSLAPCAPTTTAARSAPRCASKPASARSNNASSACDESPSLAVHGGGMQGRVMCRVATTRFSRQEAQQGCSETGCCC